jgi:hypothetical protein
MSPFWVIATEDGTQISRKFVDPETEQRKFIFPVLFHHAMDSNMQMEINLNEHI